MGWAPVSCSVTRMGVRCQMAASADGVGGSGLGPGGEEFLDDGFAAAELGDDGDDSAFGGGGDAAVGCVVAEPDDFGDEGIEVGEMEGGDVAADAVDHEPGAGLPGPADRLGGEGIIDADARGGRRRSGR